MAQRLPRRHDDPASDYLRAQQLRAMLMHDVAGAMTGVDLFVTIPFLGPQSAYTNLTGHPSVVTRCGFVEDRPKMLEFIGQLYREDQILLIAHAIESDLKIASRHAEV